MVVTVLVQGIPGNVSLAELTRALRDAFDSARDIGTFRANDVSKAGARLQWVSLDFQDGLDAMEAQSLLDGFEFQTQDGSRKNKLRAKVIHDSSQLTVRDRIISHKETSSSERSSRSPRSVRSPRSPRSGHAGDRTESVSGPLLAANVDEMDEKQLEEQIEKLNNELLMVKKEKKIIKQEKRKVKLAKKMKKKSNKKPVEPARRQRSRSPLTPPPPPPPISPSRSITDRSPQDRRKRNSSSRDQSPRDRRPRHRRTRDRNAIDSRTRDRSPRDGFPRDQSPIRGRKEGGFSRDRSPIDRSPRGRSPIDRSPRGRSPIERSPRGRSTRDPSPKYERRDHSPPIHSRADYSNRDCDRRRNSPSEPRHISQTDALILELQKKKRGPGVVPETTIKTEECERVWDAVQDFMEDERAVRKLEEVLEEELTERPDSPRLHLDEILVEQTTKRRDHSPPIHSRADYSNRDCDRRRNSPSEPRHHSQTDALILELQKKKRGPGVVPETTIKTEECERVWDAVQDFMEDERAVRKLEEVLEEELTERPDSPRLHLDEILVVQTTKRRDHSPPIHSRADYSNRDCDRRRNSPSEPRHHSQTDALILELQKKKRGPGVVPETTIKTEECERVWDAVQDFMEDERAVRKLEEVLEEELTERPDSPRLHLDEILVVQTYCTVEIRYQKFDPEEQVVEDEEKIKDLPLNERPKFVILPKVILKSLLPSRFDINLEDNLLGQYITVAFAIIRWRLRVMLRNREQMSHRQVLDLYKETYPEETNREFVQHLTADITNGMYGDVPVAKSRQKVCLKRRQKKENLGWLPLPDVRVTLYDIIARERRRQQLLLAPAPCVELSDSDGEPGDVVLVERPVPTVHISDSE